jgi:hypothetical protein
MIFVIIATAMIAAMLGAAWARRRAFRTGRELGDCNPDAPDADGCLEPTGERMIVEEWRDGDLVTVEPVTFDRPGNR